MNLKHSCFLFTFCYVVFSG